MTEDELIKVSVEAFIKEYIKESSHIFETFVDKGKQFLNIGLRKYLQKNKEHFSRVKTLLHGNTPINLYDIYFHTKLFISSTEHYNTEKLSNIFLGNRKYVTIIGDAGSGKSTLLRHLFINAIDTKFAIPILIELRDLNENEQSLEEIIYDIILEEDIAVNSELITDLLKKGKFIFFFDGFDELVSNVKNDTVEGIKSFVTRYSSNHYILTSRPNADAEYMEHFHTHKMGKLNALNDIFAFIRKQLSVDVSQRDIADKIIASIKKGEQKYIYSFLSNPLLLSIYILTFQSNSFIPTEKHVFYERVIIALFSEHDSRSKLTLERERLSKLSQEEIEDILGLFCVQSFFKNRLSWDKSYLNSIFRDIRNLDSMKKKQFQSDKLIKDLTVGISLWTEDGGIYSFAHRTLQEYYTARFVKNLKPSENDKFYTFLKNKAIWKKSQPSINGDPNLLGLVSFLCEMDTFSYKKNFLLPILTLLKDDLNFNDKSQQLISFLNHFGYNTILSLGFGENYNSDLKKYIPLLDTVEKELREIFRKLENMPEFLSELENPNIEVVEEEEDVTNIENIDDQEFDDMITEFDSEHKNHMLSSTMYKILSLNINPIIEMFLRELDCQTSDIRSYIEETEQDENTILKIIGCW